MRSYPIHFTSFRPNPGPFIGLDVISSHKILGPAPSLAAFGQGTIVGDKTIRFQVPRPGVSPWAVSGVTHVDLHSAPGSVICTMLWK